jgi:hypothetical protein
MRPVACLICLCLMAACAAPAPVLIPAGSTAVYTAAANPTLGSTAVATAAPSATPGSTIAPLNTATMAPPPTATATVAPPTSTNTPPPTNSPIATSTPSSTPAPTQVIPVVFNFSITPTTTQRIGDRITMMWQAAGEQAAICPLQGPRGPLENLCVKVPLSGSRTVTVDESMLSYFGFLLRITSGTTESGADVNVRFQCQGLRDWFFQNHPASCPAANAQMSEAAAQPFEHGLMIWTKASDTFYVFFNGGDPQLLEFGPPLLKSGASPNNRVGGAPEGRVEPVSGFGMLWRGEFQEFSNVRQRLGWGLQPEFAYTSTYQCDRDIYFCYLRVPNNKILQLHPDSSARVHYNWQEWP